MTKPKRSAQTLVEIIGEQLAEMKQEGHEFAVALWGEADADAGYLLRSDGKMVGLGEYQYGFSCLTDMTNPALTGEVLTYARSEAGRIAGGMEAVDMEAVAAGRDDMNLLEHLPYAFQAYSENASTAAKQGKMTLEQMFELLLTRPGKVVFEGNVQGWHDITLKEDVVVGELVEKDGGGFGWQPRVAIKAGDTVRGFSGGYTQVPVPGGYVSIDPGTFEAVDVRPAQRSHP